MRNMGLDIGDKRIGVALSDPEQILATPLLVIIRDNDDNAIIKIKEIAVNNNVSRIVVGMPYSLSGKESLQTGKTTKFIEKMKERINLEITVTDERYSTNVAKRLLSAGGKNRKNRHDIDSAAAAYILQGYLDSITNK